MQLLDKWHPERNKENIGCWGVLQAQGKHQLQRAAEPMGACGATSHVHSQGKGNARAPGDSLGAICPNDRASLCSSGTANVNKDSLTLGKKLVIIPVFHLLRISPSHWSCVQMTWVLQRDLSVPSPSEPSLFIGWPRSKSIQAQTYSGLSLPPFSPDKSL